MKKYWVYILECADNSYYTGCTSSLETRIVQHNAGVIEEYTSKRLPVKLVYSQEFADANEAIRVERQIKKWSRKKKQALIDGNFELLHKLAECRNETHFRSKMKKENIIP